MATIKTKEWRMGAAKLALAYMAGGDPPYQAARKTGFVRVGIMKEAIKELEKEQAKEERQQEADAQVHEPAEKPEQPEEKTAPVLAAEYQNACFSIREYAPKDGKSGMVRIWAGTRPQFIFASIDRVPMLIDLLKEVAAGKPVPAGTDEKDAIITEKNIQIAKLQRELAEALDTLEKERKASGAEELQESVGLLNVELETERLLNQKLKDKLVELLLET